MDMVVSHTLTIDTTWKVCSFCITIVSNLSCFVILEETVLYYQNNGHPVIYFGDMPYHIGNLTLFFTGPVE